VFLIFSKTISPKGWFPRVISIKTSAKLLSTVKIYDYFY
jgi:hypothetical protein